MATDAEVARREADKRIYERRVETVRALTAEGWSLTEIALELGMHPDSVSRIRRENKIKPWVRVRAEKAV